MSRMLGVSRTGYCHWRVRAPSERSIANATLYAQGAAIHAATKRSYGQALHQFQRRDLDVRRAVAPGAFQLQHDITGAPCT